MTIMSYWDRFVCPPIGLGNGDGAAEHIEGHCVAEALQHNATLLELHRLWIRLAHQKYENNWAPGLYYAVLSTSRNLYCKYT